MNKTGKRRKCAGHFRRKIERSFGKQRDKYLRIFESKFVVRSGGIGSKGGRENRASIFFRGAFLSSNYYLIVINDFCNEYYEY